MNKDLPEDELTLKWGTLKAWHFKSADKNPALDEALKYYDENVVQSFSAMAQDRSEEHNKALCMIIDAANLDEVYLDWDDKYISKEEAKDYVNNYGKK